MHIKIKLHESDLSRFTYIYNKTKNVYQTFEIKIFNKKQINISCIYEYETSTERLLNLPTYTFSSNTINKAILFRHSGDEHSWQHFMQDCLPLIYPTVDFLKNNPDIKIILPSFQKHHKYFLHEIFNLSNDIYILQPTTTYIETLYIPFFLPTSRFIDSIVPSQFRINIHKSLSYKMVTSETKYLLYLSRSTCSTRKVLNEDSLINYLTKYANDHTMTFLSFNAMDYTSLTDCFNLFYNSSICVIPHGGAAFHIYACKPSTRIIEFVSTKGSPICDIGKLAPYLDLDYNVYLTDGSHDGNGYAIDIYKVKDILNNKNMVVLNRTDSYFNAW